MKEKPGSLAESKGINKTDNYLKRQNKKKSGRGEEIHITNIRN